MASILSVPLSRCEALRFRALEDPAGVFDHRSELTAGTLNCQVSLREEQNSRTWEADTRMLPQVRVGIEAILSADAEEEPVGAAESGT